MQLYKRLVITSTVFTSVGALVGCGSDNIASSRTVPKTITINAQTTNSTAVNDTSRNLTVTYLTYHNSAYKFSVKYPNNWIKLPKPADGDGIGLVFNTNITNFSNGLNWLNTPSHFAVMNAVGLYNVTNATYDNFRNKPKDLDITSYNVVKYTDGFEIKETQRIGNALWFTLRFIDKTYIKTLQVIVPDNPAYKKIATQVLNSYNPTS